MYNTYMREYSFIERMCMCIEERKDEFYKSNRRYRARESTFTAP